MAESATYWPELARFPSGLLLSKGEAKILRLLISKNIVSDWEIIQTASLSVHVGPNVAKVRVCALRKKLAAFGYHIERVRTAGYRLLDRQHLAAEAA